MTVGAIEGLCLLGTAWLGSWLQSAPLPPQSLAIVVVRAEGAAIACRPARAPPAWTLLPVSLPVQETQDTKLRPRCRRDSSGNVASGGLECAISLAWAWSSASPPEAGLRHEVIGPGLILAQEDRGAGEHRRVR